MKLTEHFALSEFEHSYTAVRKGIDNSVPSKLIPSLKNLCEQVLEPLRQHAGEPVKISSGYRCKELNKAVGGVSSSQHMKGEAADISCSDQKKLREWHDWIRDHVTYDQLLWERANKNSKTYWVHVSCKPDISKNRKQVKEIVKYK